MAGRASDLAGNFKDYLHLGRKLLPHTSIAGLGTLTLLLAVIILIETVLEFIAYSPASERRWLRMDAVNGLITLFLGGLIRLHWPSSSVWAIGTLVGVNLLMTGISRLMLGMAARELASRAAA